MLAVAPPQPLPAGGARALPQPRPPPSAPAAACRAAGGPTSSAAAPSRSASGRAGPPTCCRSPRRGPAAGRAAGRACGWRARVGGGRMRAREAARPGPAAGRHTRLGGAPGGTPARVAHAPAPAPRTSSARAASLAPAVAAACLSCSRRLTRSALYSLTLAASGRARSAGRLRASMSMRRIWAGRDGVGRMGAHGARDALRCAGAAAACACLAQGAAACARRRYPPRRRLPACPTQSPSLCFAAHLWRRRCKGESRSPGENLPVPLVPAPPVVTAVKPLIFLLISVDLLQYSCSYCLNSAVGSSILLLRVYVVGGIRIRCWRTHVAGVRGERRVGAAPLGPA